jgi:hypothetical protein
MLCVSVSIHAAQESDPSSSKRKIPTSPPLQATEETPAKKQKISTPALPTPFQLPASALQLTPLGLDISQILVSQQSLINLLLRMQLDIMSQIEGLKRQTQPLTTASTPSTGTASLKLELDQLTTRVAVHTGLLNAHATAINDHASSIESQRDLINEHGGILNLHANALDQQNATLTTLSGPLQTIFSSAGTATHTPSAAVDPQPPVNPSMDHKSAEFLETQ